jgi:hypothetical protein
MGAVTKIVPVLWYRVEDDNLVLGPINIGCYVILKTIYKMYAIIETLPRWSNGPQDIRACAFIVKGRRDWSLCPIVCTWIVI